MAALGERGGGRWRNGRPPRMRGAPRRSGPRPARHRRASSANGSPARSDATTTLPDGQLHASLDARASRSPRSHAAFHWELAFPEVFFGADGASERRRRLRCGDRQPALGHVARRHRVIGATLGRASDDRGAVAILPLVAVVSASGQRPSQQLPVVPRARAATRQAGRARRPDPAVGDRDRSRQRVAAPAAVRSDVDRHLAWLRQPRAHFPDSSQHAVRRDVDDQRRLHGDTAVPLRHYRSGSARSRGSPHRAAVDRARRASRRGARST